MEKPYWKVWAEKNIDKRRKAWSKYNKSVKKKNAQKRYYESHKEFCKKLSMDWQNENRDKINEKSRKRYLIPEVRERRLKSHNKYIINNRIKRLAKDSINNEIKAGRLKKLPCSVCGVSKVEGHHPDYNKPLEVIWLCKEHHEHYHHRK